MRVPDQRKRALLLAAGALGGGLALGSGLLLGQLHPAITHRTPTSVAVPISDAVTTPGATSAAAAPSPAPGWKILPVATAPFVPAMLVIDKLHVQAPIELKGLDSHNQMQAPDRPADVAWYTFTARPGSGSNAVFSGHRDFAKVGPAVFWHLDQLTAGDVIDVVSGGQTEIQYRVSQTWSYSLASIPMGQVLADDRTDEITIITCSGRYTPTTGYDKRLILRAVRVPV